MMQSLSRLQCSILLGLILIASSRFLVVECLSLIEVVVSKYGLPPPITTDLNIGFCICTHEELTANIESMCRCHRNIPLDSEKQANVYPSSCLSNPIVTKCLSGRIYSPFKYLYVRVGTIDEAMTNPEWQSVEFVPNRKASAKLATSDATKKIELTYLVQGRVMSSVDEKFVKNVDIWNKHKVDDVSPVTDTPIRVRYDTTRALTHPFRSSTMARRRPMLTAHQSTGATALNAVVSMPPNSAPPFPVALLARMGTNILQIRDFLLQLAKSQRIHPTAFPVENFKDLVIRIHNRYRYHHDADELYFDTQCEIAAKRWADSLASRRSCLSHEPVRRFGENLFFFASPHFFTDPWTLAEATVHSFYLEQRFYNYRAFNWQGYFRYGHFTQMLWRSTRRVGVGVSIGRYSPTENGPCLPHCESGFFIFVVIKYDPPGNVQTAHDYMDNVRPFH